MRDEYFHWKLGFESGVKITKDIMKEEIKERISIVFVLILVFILWSML